MSEIIAALGTSLKAPSKTFLQAWLPQSMTFKGFLDTYPTSKLAIGAARKFANAHGAKFTGISPVIKRVHALAVHKAKTPPVRSGKRKRGDTPKKQKAKKPTDGTGKTGAKRGKRGGTGSAVSKSRTGSSVPTQPKPPPVIYAEEMRKRAAKGAAAGRVFASVTNKLGGPTSGNMGNLATIASAVTRASRVDYSTTRGLITWLSATQRGLSVPGLDSIIVDMNHSPVVDRLKRGLSAMTNHDMRSRLVAALDSLPGSPLTWTARQEAAFVSLAVLSEVQVVPSGAEPPIGDDVSTADTMAWLSGPDTVLSLTSPYTRLMMADTWERAAGYKTNRDLKGDADAAQQAASGSGQRPEDGPDTGLSGGAFYTNDQGIRVPIEGLSPEKWANADYLSDDDVEAFTHTSYGKGLVGMVDKVLFDLARGFQQLGSDFWTSIDSEVPKTEAEAKAILIDRRRLAFEQAGDDVINMVDGVQMGAGSLPSGNGGLPAKITLQQALMGSGGAGGQDGPAGLLREAGTRVIKGGDDERGEDSYYSVSDELRAFLPIAGFRDFTPAPGAEVQKARNQVFFDSRAYNYPLGGPDVNPLEAGNVIQRGIRYAGGVDALPVVYPGALLTPGVAHNYGTRQTVPGGKSLRDRARDASAQHAMSSRLTCETRYSRLLAAHAPNTAAMVALLASDPAWKNANQSASSVDTTYQDNNTQPLLAHKTEWNVTGQKPMYAITNDHLLPAQASVVQPFSKDPVGRRITLAPAERTDPLYNPYQRGDFTT
jgi:hypothetical protein